MNIEQLKQAIEGLPRRGMHFDRGTQAWVKHELVRVDKVLSLLSEVEEVMREMCTTCSSYIPPEIDECEDLKPGMNCFGCKHFKKGDK